MYFIVTQITMFDQTSYDQNDQPAKNSVSGFFTARGNIVLESGRYDIDLSMRTTGGQNYGVECERRSMASWRLGQPYPYTTISVPARKAKFSNPGSLFATVNSTCDRLVIIPGDAVTGSPLVFKETRNRGLEGFYEVPIGLCWQFDVRPSGSN